MTTGRQTRQNLVRCFATQVISLKYYTNLVTKFFRSALKWRGSGRQGGATKENFKTIIRIHILKRWVVFFSVTDPDPLHFWTRDGEKVGIHH
jgi:hypothetical protein